LDDTTSIPALVKLTSSALLQPLLDQKREKGKKNKKEKKEHKYGLYGINAVFIIR
jgi:hypothetical protein